MSTRVFFDTNVLVYFFSENGGRTQVAEQLLAQGGVVSVQVLNELAAVARAKLKIGWDEARVWVEEALIFCPNPRPLTLETHRSALRICARYGYGLYDGLILAAAIEAKCTALYSEDMQHGQVIEGLRIENPFLPGTTP